MTGIRFANWPRSASDILIIECTFLDAHGYPDRQNNAIARCTNNATPAFERYAEVSASPRRVADRNGALDMTSK